MTVEETKLDERPFEVVLAERLREKSSGVLQVRDRFGHEHLAQVVDGVLTAIRLEGRDLLLGELLVESAIITREQLEHALNQPEPLTDVLIASHDIHPAAIRSALAVQLRMRLLRLCRMENAVCVFVPHEQILQGSAIAAPIADPHAMLWAAVADRSVEPAYYGRLLERKWHERLRWPEGLAPSQLQMTENARALVERLVAAGDNPPTLEEWCEADEAHQRERRSIAVALLLSTDALTPPQLAAAPLARLELMQFSVKPGGITEAPRGKDLFDPRVEASDTPIPSASVPSFRSVPPPELVVTRDPDAARRELTSARDASARRDWTEALSHCSRALQNDPSAREATAMGTWVRSQLAGADIKRLALDLDEFIQAGDMSPARYFRADLRRRLGDDRGAERDLEAAVQMDAGFEPASAALEEVRRVKNERAPAKGFFARLLGKRA